MKTDIETRLLGLMKENSLFDETIELVPETNLLDAGINSIGFIRLVILLEEEFGIVIDDDDLDIRNFTTISDLLSYVRKISDMN